MFCSRSMLGLLVAAGAIAPVAAEAVTFNATLSSIRINARPGQVITRSFELTLAKDQHRAVFKARAEDWWRGEDAKQSFYAPAGSLRRSCGTWVSLNPVEDAVEAGGTLKVRVTVSVPAELSPGGYWCALTVDEAPDPLSIGTEETVDVRFLASVSVGIFVFIAPVERAGEIVDLEVSPDEARVTVRNNGNAPIEVEGRIEFLRPDDDKALATVFIPRATVLTEPIITGILAAPLPDPTQLPSGRYLVRAIIDLGLDHYLGVEQEFNLTREQAIRAQR